MAALSNILASVFKWNPLTAVPYAALDHAGVVDKAKKAIDPEVPTLAVPTLPDMPDASADTAKARAAAEMQRRRAATGKGRSSTLLTGPGGLVGQAPTMRQTLLGR